MIEAFSITGGVTNDMVSRMLRHPRQSFPLPGLLGAPDDAAGADRLAELRQKGYLVFPALLDGDTCDELTRFALSIPGSALKMDEGDARQPEGGLYRRETPTSTKFDYDASLIVQHPVVQRLLADNSLLSLAQDYLGSAPIVDIVAMWWSAAYKSCADKEAAQYWHFDMDRSKWLKVFFYLSDVGPDNGPHSFIEGTHRNQGIPYALRSKGYSRLTDCSVSSYFASNRVVELTGARGTVIIEDTRGLHKGLPVRAGDRLILQLEYTNSLFGGRWAPIRSPASPVDSFLLQRASTPVVFEAFE